MAGYFKIKIINFPMRYDILTLKHLNTKHCVLKKWWCLDHHRQEDNSRKPRRRLRIRKKQRMKEKLKKGHLSVIIKGKGSVNLEGRTKAVQGRLQWE